MNKIGWFVCVCIFIFVTAFVMSVDTSTQTRQVQFSNQAFEINNRGNQVVNNSSSKINFNDTNIQNKHLAANNSKINLQSTEVNTKNEWSKWKSNFVNKILDDSVYIKSLDRYQTGNWLWYSFIVDDRGRISNIQVKSPTIEQADKDKVAKLIKSYEYTAITIFPANSKRKTASISAVMMLSDEAQKSKPSDFNDIEHIKFKL